MCTIMDLARANRKIAELEEQVPEPFPAPPTGTVTIDANALMGLLRPYGITLSGGTGDYLYKLMTDADAERFLKWYQENARIKPEDYTPDDRDCDKYAWEMRAQALYWSNYEYVWGYIEAEGRDPAYQFPNHGYCFVVNENYQVKFCDVLEIAGPDDELGEAFEIKCNSAKA